jgi:uncharacterized membrane protein YfcA
VAVVAIASGAVASVSGFGIGSLLTPMLALQLDPKVAVAAVSIPHLVGTALRFWSLRAHVSTRVLWTFGAASAAGGRCGALLGTAVHGSALLGLLGALLLFVGTGELTGLTRRLRFHGPWAWLAGGLSGLFGGLVGNQGGLRAGALLGFDLPKATFVSTATAIALVVDAARMPVYAWTQAEQLLAAAPLVGLATAGVVVGTLAGQRVLSLVPEPVFRATVATLLVILGLSLLVARALPPG